MNNKPFFTTFELWLLAFIVVMAAYWIGSNIQNKIRASKEKATRKMYSDKWKILRSQEPMDSSMSNRNNLTFKN